MKKQHLFHLTTLRLTAWYTLILLFISVMFSFVVFEISTSELRRGFGPPRPDDSISQNLFSGSTLRDNSALREWQDERVHEGTTRLIARLVLFNIAVLATGAAGSYLLARRTLEPVEAAMEAQTRFSSDAAHELRTPLTIMQSEIEVGLRDSKATKASHALLLKSNLDEVEHMRTLTDRLLLLANQDDLVLEPTSLEAVAMDAVERSVALAQSKHMSVENEVGAIQVQGNAKSLADLLFILIDNAIKYSPEKSTVTLRAVTKNRMAELQVADDGPGIEDADLPHIFDRFYRADTARSAQNVAGHGLGLSIAQAIVEAHGGTISAANGKTKGKRKGAVFTITLPLA